MPPTLGSDADGPGNHSISHSRAAGTSQPLNGTRLRSSPTRDEAAGSSTRAERAAFDALRRIARHFGVLTRVVAICRPAIVVTAERETNEALPCRQMSVRRHRTR